MEKITNKEFKQQLIKKFNLGALIDQLNELCEEDKEYYLEIILTGIVHNTSESPTEAARKLESVLELYKNYYSIP